MSKCLGSCPMHEVLQYKDKEYITSYKLFVCNNCGILVKYNLKGERFIIHADNMIDLSGDNNE